MFNVAKTVVEKLRQIMRLQSVCVYNECRIVVLQRGIDKGVVLERDPSINSLTTKMLRAPFCDRDGILKFQHQAYHEVMSLEIKSLVIENVNLNYLMSKLRRSVRAITADNVLNYQLIS